MKLKQITTSVIVVLLILISFLFIPTSYHTSYAEGTELPPKRETLPSEYCMRDEYIVYAQHQDSHGYCWNFAATMAASTTIMKATGEYYDFSELWTGVSLVTRSKYLSKMGAGGTFSYQYDAMKSSGLMLESDLPYQYSNIVSNENATDYYNFYERYSNDDLARCLSYSKETTYSSGDVEEIKSHIYNHGSIYLTFTFRTGFKESGDAYYLEPNQTNTNSNHAVSVIGWDDNYQKEFYLNGSETPTVFKGAWIILNSYTEKNGKDGISFVFYDDNNIGSIIGYKYEIDTSYDLYFYDKIESGYAYPTTVKGKYYGDFTAEYGITNQKNIFYDDVNLEYSYTASEGAGVEGINIYLDDEDVTDRFGVRIDNRTKRFYISKDNADYGHYKVIVTYGNGERSDTYLNNFFVTHGLVGEEVEFDYDNNSFDFNPGRDLEYYSFMLSDKNYVVYTNKLSGEISFLPTEQSVYSEKNMSIPNISYEITNGESCTATYSIKADTGYDLEYNFIFEYYEDASLQPVNIYYDLGGGVNHSKNYSQELANATTSLMLYEPTRPGYTFAGWYLDYGNGSRKVTENDGVYYISWDDIHHMGESPTLNATSNYKKYYKNSNTVFVYAHWEEEEYHKVDISIIGEGTSQISESILVRADDSVRYLFKCQSGWCLSELKINDKAVNGNELIEIIKHGLLLDDIDQDISITATFFEGVYISLKYGDNIETAYIIGTIGDKSERFYDGDCIPKEYFSSAFDKLVGIKRILPEIDDLSDYSGSNRFEDDDLPPLQIAPLFGGEFTLVVVLSENKPGYTYVLDDILSYTSDGNGVFTKSITISGTDKVAQIDVGSAVEKPIVPVEITYTVGTYVVDHYISDDKNATSGDKSPVTYDAGQIVYLFIKKEADNFIYHYRVPDSFESIGGDWYRRAIYVSDDEPNIGRIVVYREYQKYTVTWANWDGSKIYSEEYRYGETPVFHDENSDSDCPVRPDDDLYSYIFIGWDKDIQKVNYNITYTATYERVLRRYVVSVEPTENGTVTPDGSNFINRLDIRTYIFTPDPGYKIKDVILNGESIGAISSYTFADISCDQTLRVEFERIQYSVNIILGEHGSADLSGVVKIEHGSGITVLITPKEHFEIDFIKLDGAPVQITDSLVVTNITKDTLIEIAFKQNVFGITTTSSENGRVTQSFEVFRGGNARVDFSPDNGYRVKDVKIDGVSIGAVNQYTFTNVEHDHTVFVEYEKNKARIFIIIITAIVLVEIVVLTVMIIKIRSYMHTLACQELPQRSE